MNEKEILFPEWHGEFGWEICTWIPYLRFRSQFYDQVYTSSFKGMKPLYQDFSEFKEHKGINRSLDYPKRYRLRDEAIYLKYGKPNKKYDVLIHARGIKRKSNINYQRFDEVINELKNLNVAIIGTSMDQKIKNIDNKNFNKKNFDDLRDINLKLLMNYLSGSKVCIGISSGVMHLASFCGCPHLVWSYDHTKTYYWESLEKRYKETWNPFQTKCEYIPKLFPEPKEILHKIESFL